MKGLFFFLFFLTVMISGTAYYKARDPVFVDQHQSGDIKEVSKEEKLLERYLVSYGNPNAPIKITEYFSFSCPHCLNLFSSGFFGDI